MALLAHSSQKVTEKNSQFPICMLSSCCACEVTPCVNISVKLHSGFLQQINETNVTTSDKCDLCTVQLFEKGHGVT